MIRKVAIILAAGFAMFGIACRGGGDGWETGGPLEIVASRTSGVAPLLVVFEGDLHPGQASPAPFHELDYLWDFGDPGSGTWSTTGAPKDEEYGPIVAHVFEEPGTYNVRLAVRNAAGDLTTGEVSITVQDPDDVFAGSSTVCFSGSGSFDGCPGGATEVTTSSMGEVMNHLGTGKRLLLHRGETFNGGGGINVAGPGILGAYGSGDAPRLALAGGEATGIFLSGENPQISDWRVMDLEIDGSGAGAARGVEAGGTLHDVLVLRVSVHDISTGFEFSDFVLEFYGHEPHDVVGLVDSQASAFNGGSGQYGAFLSGERFATLGTDIDLGTNGEHTVRVSMMRASIFGHVVFANPASGKHCLKLHAPIWGGSEAEDYTERVVVRRSTFVGANNDWLVVPGPENETSDERVRDVLFDGNHFVAGPGTQVGLVIECEGVSARNNVFDMSAGFERTCVTIQDRGDAPAPRDVLVMHNTCYSSSGSVSMAGAGGYPNIAVVNNLVASAGGASVGASSDENTIVEGNVTADDAGFAAADPSTVEDFALSSESPAVNAGAALPVATRDLDGTLRPVGGAPDPGAFERE